MGTEPRQTSSLQTNRRRVVFCGLFAAFLTSLVLVFDQWEPLFGTLYLYPVSWVAAALLDLVGVPAVLDAGPVDIGICVLTMEQIVFHVEHECTGLYALFIYLAAVFAYPARMARKGEAVLVGIPAFFAYSALRLVLLGVIAQVTPTWVQFCHIYLMVLMNLGFMLFLWSSWVNRTPVAPEGT